MMLRYGLLVVWSSLIMAAAAPSCDLQALLGSLGDFGAGQEQPETTDPFAKPTAAIPLSRHYVQVVFDGATGADAALSSYYQITNPAGAVLVVRSVIVNSDRTRVILDTGPQEELLYTLRILPAGVDPADAPSVTFTGSAGAEPYLAAAVALDNVTVLATYSEPMDGNVGASAVYRIESPDLNIFSAVRASDTTVLLTTAPQLANRYTLRVSGVSARGNKLIDPTRNSVLFDGIAPKDESAPAMLSAEAISDTKVLVSFSEPLAEGGADPVNFGLSPALTITDAAFSAYNTQVLLTMLPLPAGTEYTVTASSQIKDKAGNVIDPARDSARFTFTGQTRLVDASRLPRVVGAISTGNTGVRVAFNKIMGAGLEEPSNYSIIGADTSYLAVAAVRASDDKTSVELTTSSQSAGVYTVHVVNVRDVQGNPLPGPSDLLAPPQGVDPAAATFNGIPPQSAADLVDADGDGLPDAQETLGWFVTVKTGTEGVELYHVTSNPNNPDTDGDGLNDPLEKNLVIDPRKADTDGDQVNDYDEFNVYYSDPINQDGDGDTLNDWLEIFFYRTSAVLADTDGDQLKDNVELLERNRNPLVSDLPLPQITVDDVRLGLKITSSYTDEQGTTQRITDATSTNLTQSRSNTLSTSDTTSTESENQFSQKLGVEVSYGKDGWGGKVSAEAGFGQRRLQGFSSTVSRQSAEASQQEYERSIEQALETSQRRSVSRSIDEATIQASVNIKNKSDIAFTITNLEVSVQQQDRRNSRRFRPIATLRPSGATDPLNQPKYNLGPFDPERGPIIFQNTEVFPNLVDDLMREPTGLIFQVVNFDILDEFGRNFVFSSQEVNDRTAGITVDFGDGTVEQYRVATASTFDENGRPVGISMRRGLEILGLTLSENDQPVVIVDPLPPAVRKTYGTRPDTDGVERLVRVRGVQNDLVAVPEAEKRFWAVVSSNIEAAPDADFSGLQLLSGDDYLIMFTRDIDKDGLFEREEYLYGSDDRSTDTDADTLGDFFEVRTGWTVARKPGQPYKTFSSPVRADSDGDGLQDNTEKTFATDPNRSDTDEDALTDAAEISPQGFDFIVFDGDSDDTNDKLLVITPYSSWSIIDGGNGRCDTTATGDDVQAVAAGAGVQSGNLVIGPGPNGVIDTTAAGDDKVVIAEEIVNGAGNRCDTTAAGDDVQVVALNASVTQGQVLIRAGLNGVIDTASQGDDYIRVKHAGVFTTDPLNQDTDGDGIPDGREILLGTNPNARDAGNVIDSDNDGLYDAEEDAGWTITIYASNGTPTTRLVTSNKFRADSDVDGLPDVYERALKSDPRLVDTDADGLFDRNEFDPDDTDRYYAATDLEQARLRCNAAQDCTAPTAPVLAQRLRTNLVKKDTDADGRDDNVEVNTPWTVQVASPYAVFSKPYAADFDNDGLNDARELLATSDPNDANTDKDNATDGYEVNVRGTSPVTPQKRVRFTVANISIASACNEAGDGFNDHIEFEGKLLLTAPSGSQSTIYDKGCVPEEGDCCSSAPTVPATFSVNSAHTYIMTPGQSFRLHSSGLAEHDDLGCGIHSLDDSFGSVDQSFSYDSLSGGNQGIASSGGDCSLTVNVTLSVD